MEFILAHTVARYVVYPDETDGLGCVQFEMSSAEAERFRLGDEEGVLNGALSFQFKRARLGYEVVVKPECVVRFRLLSAFLGLPREAISP